MSGEIDERPAVGRRVRLERVAIALKDFERPRIGPGLDRPTAEGVGPEVVDAVHLVGVNHWLVFIRANFLVIQAALFAYMIWGLLQ